MAETADGLNPSRFATSWSFSRIVRLTAGVISDMVVKRKGRGLSSGV